MRIIIYEGEMKVLVQKHVKDTTGLDVEPKEIYFTLDSELEAEIFLKKSTPYEKALSDIQARKLKAGEFRIMTDGKTGEKTLEQGLPVPEIKEMPELSELAVAEEGTPIEELELTDALLMLEDFNSDQDPIRLLNPHRNLQHEIISPAELDGILGPFTLAKDIKINFCTRTPTGDKWVNGTLLDMVRDRNTNVTKECRYPSDDKNAIHQE